MPNYQDYICLKCNKCSTNVILETSRFLEKSKYSCPNCEQELPTDFINALQAAINTHITANNAWVSAQKIIPFIEIEGSTAEKSKAFMVTFTDKGQNDK